MSGPDGCAQVFDVEYKKCQIALTYSTAATNCNGSNGGPGRGLGGPFLTAAVNDICAVAK